MNYESKHHNHWREQRAGPESGLVNRKPGRIPRKQWRARAEGRRSPAPRLVERVTALRGQSIARPRQPKNVIRRQSQYDIYGKDPEIPYVKFEAAARDLVCSLMERQDRMNEEIFYKINDLGYRVEDLEQNRISEGGRL